MKKYMIALLILLIMSFLISGCQQQTEDGKGDTGTTISGPDSGEAADDLGLETLDEGLESNELDDLDVIVDESLFE